jgi:hypothetical protein
LGGYTQYVAEDFPVRRSAIFGDFLEYRTIKGAGPARPYRLTFAGAIILEDYLADLSSISKKG